MKSKCPRCKHIGDIVNNTCPLCDLHIEEIEHNSFFTKIPLKARITVALFLSLAILIGAFTYLRNNYLEGDLNGEIFIVTKGGQNIRLGLVEVRLIPEDEIRKYVSNKIPQFRKEKEMISLKLENAQKKLEEAKSAYFEAVKYKIRKESDIEMNKLQNQVDVATDRKAARTTDDELRDIQASTDVSIDEVNKEHRYKLMQLEIEVLQNEVLFFTSGAFFFNGLPDGVTKTKTDADGKFSLRIKRGQRMALAAQSNRKIIGDEENYYWLLWTSFDGNSLHKIVLSNDNLWETNPPASVIRLD